MDMQIKFHIFTFQRNRVFFVLNQTRFPLVLNLLFFLYFPSDTARRLDEGIPFTFSLTNDPELFYRAALTGHDEPNMPELDLHDLEEKGERYLYPSKASKTYFCEVKRTEVIKETDQYGEAKIKLIEGKILEKKGEGEYIGRENPLVDAMVHASRIFLCY